MHFDNKLKEFVRKVTDIQLSVCRRGPKYKHKLRFVVFLTLVRLRTALPLRFIAHLYRINHVTLWRWINRVVSILAKQGLNKIEVDTLIVDTTSTRIRTTDLSYYSGYKKARVVKVQVIADVNGMIHAVSKKYLGSIHDKKIWETENYQIPEDAVMLADKAYVGINNERLVSPIRRSDTVFKNNHVASLEFNRNLSKKRIKIEHVFAQLKTWRIIHHYFPSNPERYSTVFTAIAVIHNFIVANNRRAN